MWYTIWYKFAAHLPTHLAAAFEPPTSLQANVYDLDIESNEKDGAKQKKITDFFKSKPKSVIFEADEPTEEEIIVETYNFQCAVCNKLFKSNAEAEEHFATHGANETIISLMQKIHEQGEFFHRTSRQHKNEINELKQRVHVLTTSLSQIQATPRPAPELCQPQSYASKAKPAKSTPQPRKQSSQKRGSLSSLP